MIGDIITGTSGLQSPLKSPLRGVNLGGWLVLERWITPSLFANTDAPDELTYCRQADAADWRRLQQFRQNFITLNDFRWIRQQGLNAVRIPVGHWVFGDNAGDTAPFAATIGFLDQAFTWARDCGLRIVLSLHGAPGSQNGNDHSGSKGAVAWHTSEHNGNQTLDVLERLAVRYKDNQQLAGIGLLNEPSPSIPHAQLKRFYRAAYQRIRRWCDRSVAVVFSDGFAPSRWRWTLHWPRYRNVWIDSHQYRIFSTKDKTTTAADHIQAIRNRVPAGLRRMRRHHGLMVGEWSAALDNQSLIGLDAAQAEAALMTYGQTQRQAFDAHATAWFYWTYKTEYGGPWSFRHSSASNVQGGLLQAVV